MISSKTVNDLHIVVLNFSKSCRITVLMLYIILKILKLIIFSILGTQ